MLETPHVIVGAVLAVKIGNPLLAVPLSFISHLVLDKVPHWNPHIGTEKRTLGRVTQKSKQIIVVDAVVGLIVGCALAGSVLPDLGLAVTMLLCSFAAVLPDLMEAPYYFMNSKADWIDKWVKFQKSIQADANIFWGNLTQVITIILALLWMFY